MDTKSIKIQLMKKLHWLLASFFVLVWLSGDDLMSIHQFAGYGILIVSLFFIIKKIVKRIINGRLFQWAKPSISIKWLKSNLIFIILISLLLAGASGYLADSSGRDSWEDLHEVLANFTLIGVLSHIALMLMNKLKHQIITKQQLTQIGQDIMNHSFSNKSRDWLLSLWQKVTLQWNQNSGKNWLIRAAWLAVSLSYAVIVTSLFLAILPVILVSALMFALMLRSDMTKQHAPVTINVTPEAN